MLRGANTKVGDRFGSNVVLAITRSPTQTHARFLLHCDCGNERWVATGFRKARGCYKCTARNGQRVKMGERSGNREVIAVEPAGDNGKPVYVVQCECGRISRVKSDDFRRTTVCSECRNQRLGATNPTAKFVALREANPALYKRWRSMKGRCASGQSPSRKVWGGRGIKVCDEWNASFPAFVAWALANGFTGHLTLDRIDENKGYEPGNCQWLTRSDNSKKARAVYRGPLRKSPFAEHFPIEALFGSA